MSYVKKNILKGKKIELERETIFESEIEGDISIALALIEKSQPHYHNEITEWYYVVAGKMNVYLDGKVEKLKANDILKIEPKTVHWAEGKAKILVISHPPWRKEDHLVVK